MNKIYFAIAILFVWVAGYFFHYEQFSFGMAAGVTSILFITFGISNTDFETDFDLDD